MVRRSTGWLLALVVVYLFAADPVTAHAVDLFGRKDSTSKEKEDKPSTPESFDTKVETKLIGEYANFAGLEPVVLDGVGLVVGLSGTGGDPAPSPFRTALLEDMKRLNVPNPNAILRSPDTALVRVRAYLPPLVSKGETIDIELNIPDSAEATSLKGGWLMMTTLHEQAYVAGRGTLKGHPYARAEGAVIVGGLEAPGERVSALQKRGKIPGGATVLKERDLAIYLRNEYRDVRNTTRVAEAIGRRFHHFDKHGIKKPMAEAKNDQRIVLLVHPRYKNNFPRYLQVIRHIAFRETPVAARVRMQKLAQELLEPETSDRAALQLEAIGTDAIPTLQAGLKAPTIECRFHSAIALAYLANSEGLPVLKEAARTERAFRVFALAAMSIIDDAEAHLALRELMSENSAETRYGAFRSLWTLDRRDPFIRPEPIYAGMAPGDELDPNNKRKPDYTLHVLETQGEPMVHTTLRTRPEVVIFGAEQKMSTPLLLAAGQSIMISAQPGSSFASVTRFEPDRPDQRLEVPLEVAAIVRAASRLGATYPDVVQLLSEASHQSNLPSRLAIDTLPAAGRVYERPSADGSPRSSGKTRIGRDNLAPNIFGSREEEEAADDSEDDSTSSQASVPPTKSRPKAAPDKSTTPGEMAGGTESGSETGQGSPTDKPAMKKSRSPFPKSWSRSPVKSAADEEMSPAGMPAEPAMEDSLVEPASAVEQSEPGAQLETSGLDGMSGEKMTEESDDQPATDKPGQAKKRSWLPWFHHKETP